MLQYLLNATAIWLISLVLFDLCLRRESYHNYNRFYLLFTFLLGAMLPMWQWQNDSELYPKALQQPVERVISAKENIVSVGTPSVAIDWQQWLTLLYLAGALVALCQLMADVVKLAAYYRGGTKSRQDNWTLIETGKDHAPFSFRNLLFVSSTAAYDADEWHMVLTHERRHTALLHFADLLLMQVARVVFWFHPLVYMYNKRLLLVHEYQADNASAQQPQVYGKFLVEQALLQTAPALSHSFNRSPIKNRIIMLTRKSTTAAKTKMLVFVPLAVVCIVCFSKNSFSKKFDRHGNIITYKGNTIELSGPTTDTIEMQDPVTEKFQRSIMRKDESPVKVNNELIYDADALKSKPAYPDGQRKLEAYVIKSLKPLASGLEDGDYSLFINNIIVDKNGAVVYYNVHGLMRYIPDPKAFGGARQQIMSDKTTMDALKKMMDNIADFEPATVKGNNVPCKMHVLLPSRKIVVTNHKLTVTDTD